MTTIGDPAQAPAKELAALYHERWDIEGFFKQIKSVQLNADKIFRSKSPDGVRQECWAHLAVHYATMCIAVDAAHQARLLTERIRSAESGNVASLYVDVLAVLGDILSRERDLLPDGVSVETDWQDVMSLSDWELPE